MSNTLQSQIILASASPRRRELLDQINITYDLMPVDIDESPMLDESPKHLAMRLAKTKAEAAWQLSDQSKPVLGSDTLGELEGEVLIKPRDYEHAFAMLLRMSGQWHDIYSTVAVTFQGRTLQALSHSRVLFRSLCRQDIEAYWQSGEPQDKAGAYAIQGLGAIFVEKLEGSFSGVMGLPLAETSQLLKQYGIDSLEDGV